MKLELSLHAINLKNVAGAMKGTSDPYAIVTNLNGGTNHNTPILIGKTEIINNTLNPEWVKIFIIDNYELGNPIKLVISIFDSCNTNNNIDIKKHKSMGSVVYDVDEILGSRGNTKAKLIKNTKGKIYASVRPSNINVNNGKFILGLACTNLKNTEGMFSKSDPFYEISRNISAAGGLTWDNIYRSEFIKNNLNPTWKIDEIDMNILCNGNKDLPLRINIYDYESSGKHILMGTIETNVTELMRSTRCNNNGQFQLKSSKTNGQKNTGLLLVRQADIIDYIDPSSIESIPLTQQMKNITVTDNNANNNNNNINTISQQPTFIDYISGGCQLNVSVAIDFTGSNGDPRKPGTLHYIHESKNDYEKAITSIVSILLKYDYDHKIPTYGFGAKFNNIVNHCFSLNNYNNTNDSNVDDDGVIGVEGVLDVYHKIFQSSFVMSSPTSFIEVIDKVSKQTQKNDQTKEQIYTILLIISDGSVSDIDNTAKYIQNISNDKTIPLSIIIIGVGNANFTSMQFLDDLKSNNNNNNNTNTTSRDIVQFVEFNKYSNNKNELTKITLQEIPNQLVQYYYNMNNILPNPPIQLRNHDILNIDNNNEEEEEEIDLRFDVNNDNEGDIIVTGTGLGNRQEQW